MATKKSASISNVRSPQSDFYKSLGNVHKYDGIYEAVVISSEDVQKNGRIKVRLKHTNSDVDFIEENNSQSYLDITVRWSSPFAGATNIVNTIPSGDNDDDKTFEGTQKSYGMWMIPPDSGNKVLVSFINGDIAKGVIIGCMYQSFMNHMVPGIARSKTFTENEGETLELPVAEYNKKSDEADNVDWKTVRDETGQTPTDNVTRPTHTAHFEGLKEQGLEQDKTRGLTSSSARRESPSQVFGILTPDANQFVMDDGDQQLIRLRTKSGAQILLDETNGNVYIINKKGTGWIEMDNAGKIDVWAEDSISVRSQKDINLRADRDLNIESGRDINIKTNKTENLERDKFDGGKQTNFVQPTETTDLLKPTIGKLNLDVAGELNIKTVGITKLTSGSNFHLSTTGSNHFTASASTEIQSGGNHNETATEIHMNGPAAITATKFDGLSAKVDKEGNIFFTNTKYTRDATTGNRETEEVGTILTRFPTREPFAREEFIEE